MFPEENFAEATMSVARGPLIFSRYITQILRAEQVDLKRLNTIAAIETWKNSANDSGVNFDNFKTKQRLGAQRSNTNP